jgi:hypothetical protein
MDRKNHDRGVGEDIGGDDRLKQLNLIAAFAILCCQVPLESNWSANEDDGQGM